nr:uncharacterized protein LOC112009725 [Quercus suber]
MSSIDPSVITHRLNVSPSSKPICQKKRVFAPEREKTIKEEVQKLTTAQHSLSGKSITRTGGIGIVLQSPEIDKLKHRVCLQYQTTNNEAEYETLFKWLELAKLVEADSILVLGDFQLVIGQVNKTCEAKEDRIKRYLKKVVRLMKKFKEADFVQISREENMETDTLAKEVSTNEASDGFNEI